MFGSETIAYGRFFQCKYCSLFYKNSKKFVIHKLKNHETEMERDYGPKIRNHSYFNPGTSEGISIPRKNSSGSVILKLGSQEQSTSRRMTVKSELVFEGNTSLDENSSVSSETTGERKLRRSSRPSSGVESVNGWSTSERKYEEEEYPENHVENDPPSSNYENGMEWQTIGTSSFKCRHCSKEFASKVGVKKHEYTHQKGGKPFRCMECGKGFMYLSAKTRHKQFCRGSNFREKCRKCNMLYSKKDNRSTHFRTCIGSKGARAVVRTATETFTGPSTNRGGLAKTGWNRPGKIHRAKKRVRVPDENLSNLVIHNLEARQTALENITKIRVGGLLKNRCEFCQKVFSDMRHAIACVCSHTGDALYSCKLCGKSFSNKHHTTLHVRLHTGEKPYACNMCDMAFMTCRRRTIHEEGHGDLFRNFLCQKCGRWFKIEKTKDLHEISCDK